MVEPGFKKYEKLIYIYTDTIDQKGFVRNYVSPFEVHITFKFKFKVFTLF